MSSRLGTSPRLTPRHLLATAALAAVLGLGASLSTPTGSASAAPKSAVSVSASASASSSGSSSSSSSSVETESAWRSRWASDSRSFFVDASAIARLLGGQISAAGLAGQVCTANHPGKACVQLVAYALRGSSVAVNPAACSSTSGYTVVFPRIYQSHCGR
jgi:hypothetical protein